jgi:hypothetical protein
MKNNSRNYLKHPRIYISILLIILSFISLFTYWSHRPNEYHTLSRFPVESWEVVNDGMHNAFTDLIYWNNKFFLVYTKSSFHAGSNKSCLIIESSSDARNWTRLARLTGDGDDIRDPKFAIIKDKLFIYALKNAKVFAFPTETFYSISNDGLTWSGFKSIGYRGYLFWRPKTSDNIDWFVAAYWYKMGKSILLKSQDGINWSYSGPIYSGKNAGETDIVFCRPDSDRDGTVPMIASVRSEFGDCYLKNPEGSTMILSSYSPYHNWTHLTNSNQRLDGPCLFIINKRVYAIGRYQPFLGGICKYLGGLFSQKRTAIYLVSANGLSYIAELPSSGDTSYAGSVVVEDYLYISYYTSDINKDYPWIMGLFCSSSVRMARVKVKDLEK